MAPLNLTRACQTISSIFFLLAISAVVVGLMGLWTPKRRTIVVVGAGLGGVTAGLELHRRREELGISRVVILEANDYIGGRIKPAMDPEVPDRQLGELGATFLHLRGMGLDDSNASNPQHPLLELLDRFEKNMSLGVDSHRRQPLKLRHYNYSRGTYFDADGTAFPREMWLEGKADFTEIFFTDATEKIDEKWERSGGKGDIDEPLSVILDDLHFYEEHMDPHEQRLFDLFCFQHVVQDMQAPLQEISAFHYDGTAETTILEQHDYVVEGGVSNFMKWQLEDAGAKIVDAGAKVPRSARSELGSQGPSLIGDEDEFVVVLNAPAAKVHWANTHDHMHSANSDGETTSSRLDFDAECELWSGVLFSDVQYDLHGGTDKEPSWLLRWLYNHVLLRLDELTCLLVRVAKELSSAIPAPHTNQAHHDSVFVECHRLGIEADRVVIAVPLGVLKASLMNQDSSPAAALAAEASLYFDPPLPQPVQEAVADLGVNPAHKVILCWRREDVFWPTQPAGGNTQFFFKYANENFTEIPTSPYGKGEHLEFINIHELYDNGCLGVGMEGALAKRMANTAAQEQQAFVGPVPPSKSNVVQRIMRELRLMFGSDLPYPTKMVHSDWTTNPRFLGGYSHHRVDNVEENKEFTYPINHKVYFAGEHCSQEHYGSMHGALRSGQDAALAVAHSINTVHALILVSFLFFIVVAAASFWFSC